MSKRKKPMLTVTIDNEISQIIDEIIEWEKQNKSYVVEKLLRIGIKYYKENNNNFDIEVYNDILDRMTLLETKLEKIQQVYNNNITNVKQGEILVLENRINELENKYNNSIAINNIEETEPIQNISSKDNTIIWKSGYAPKFANVISKKLNEKDIKTATNLEWNSSRVMKYISGKKKGLSRIYNIDELFEIINSVFPLLEITKDEIISIFGELE